MMNITITGDNGGCARLGNQIIRNLAVSIIAEKHNLKVDYFNNELIKKFGINLFSGENQYDNTILLTTENYFSIYFAESLQCNLYPNGCYFQTIQITNMIYNYLRSKKMMSNIINNNQFKERYNANNDLYVHIRLTDVAFLNPGIQYYLKTIENIQFDKLYISTDDITHEFIGEIFNHYPLAIILNFDELTTIQFASTCKNIILSHGTFSAVIGYLAFFSTVNYPEYMYDKMWHGDIFSIDGWIKHTLS